MTSKSYIRTVGEKLGWSHVPPGSRFSSYQIPQYKKLSAAYGPLTLASINATDSAHPTLKPVPYTGIGFLDIPEFEDLGTNVSDQFSAAIAGQKPAAAALALAQLYAQAIGKLTGLPDNPRRDRHHHRSFGMIERFPDERWSHAAMPRT